MTRPWAVTTICCMAMVTLSFTVGGLAMCMPSMSADLDLDYGRQGIVFSAPMWSFVLAVVVAAAADRIGFRVPMALGSTLQASGWLILAEAQSGSQAVLAAALAGAGGSVIDPLLTPMVCAVYPDRRTRMANFLHAFYCLGLVGVAVTVCLLQPAGVSWRWTFRALGIICLPYGLLSAVLSLPLKAHAGPVRLKVRSLVLRPAFLLVSLAMILAAVTELGPANWLPSLVQTVSTTASPPRSAGVLAGAGMALFGALMAGGRFLASAAARRLGPHRMLSAAALACTVCLAAVMLPLGTMWRLACLGVVGFSVACFWPTLLAVAGDRFPQAGASMFSVLSAVGGIGCAAAPLALGYLAGAIGDLAPAIAACSLAPAAILVIARHLR